MVNIAVCSLLNLNQPDGGSSRVMGLSNRLSKNNNILLIHNGDLPIEATGSIISKRITSHNVAKTFDIINPLLPSIVGTSIRPILGQRMIKSALRGLSPDVVYSHQHYPTYDFIHNKDVCVPIVFDIHGLMENLSIDCLHSTIYQERLKKIQIGVEKKCIDRSDYIFSSSSAMNNYLCNRYDTNYDKFFVVPDGFEPELFERSTPEAPSLIRGRMGFDGKIVIGYIGAISKMHDSINMVKSFEIVNRELGSRAIDVRFLVISGSIPDHIIIPFEDVASRIPNLVRLPPIPHVNLPEYLASMDILMIPYSNNRFSNLVPHLKTYEYMASGKPIVASKTQGNRDVLRHESNSVMVEIGDSNSMASGILWLIDNLDYGRRIGEKAKNEAYSKYTWGDASLMAENAFASIVKKNTS